MPSFVAAHSGNLPLHPAPLAIWIALLLLTLAAYILTFLSAKHGKQSTPAYLLFGAIAAMLINVLVPHIPAALILRQYTPGVLTATLINLPLMSLFLALALREGWVSGARAARCAILVSLALFGAILAFFAIA